MFGSASHIPKEFRETSSSVSMESPHGVHPKIINMTFPFIKYVDSMDSTWSIWSPYGVYMESTWTLLTNLAGLPAKKNCMWTPSGLQDSTWTPLESRWNRWGRVKFSKMCRKFRAVISYL